VLAGAEPPRNSPWLSAVILCTALLVLPALVWFLAPRPGGFVLPPPAGDPRPIATTELPEPPPEVRAPVREEPAEAPAAVGPVTGFVLDPDGKAAKNASIGCDDRDKHLVTNTDEDGNFSLGPDASGCLAVADHPDFMPSERTSLTPGRRNTIRLRRPGGIEGDVVDEQGAPVTSFVLGVESYLASGPPSDKVPAGESKPFQDPRGAFAWKPLPPGRYVFTAGAEGRPPARSRPVDVEIDRTTRSVRITLPRGSTLRGAILDADTRRPIADATIALDSMTSTGANLIQPARSDDAGFFVLDGVPAGPFSIRVAHERYRTRIVPGLVTRGAPSITRDVELHLREDGGPGDEFAGIGAFLAPTPKGVIVGSVLPGGPAESAGLKTGDRLLTIDGERAEGLPLTDCVQRLRGAEGTRVLVTVAREGGSPLDVTITRRVQVR
jgi:hypothetical protein